MDIVLLFTALAFRKCKKDFSILNNILVQDFCPLKTEIARLLSFSWGFIKTSDLVDDYCFDQ